MRQEYLKIRMAKQDDGEFLCYYVSGFLPICFSTLNLVVLCNCF